MNNFVQNQYAGTREQRGAVWLTKHGADEIQSVSVATYPQEGSDSNLFRQIVEGTVLAKSPDGLYRPCALDSAQAVVSSANVIPVADALQFEIGQFVELPASVDADASRFRLITAIDYDNSEITVGGATFSLSSGDVIQVDPSRAHGEVKTTASAPGGATTIAVLNGTVANFVVGDVIEVDDVDGTITALDGTEDAETITVAEDIAVSDGDHIVSAARGEYKITTKTVTIDEYRFTPSNVLVPYRPHGRVKEVLVVGLVPAAKTALEGRIIFDQRTIA